MKVRSYRGIYPREANYPSQNHYQEKNRKTDNPLRKNIVPCRVIMMLGHVLSPQIFNGGSPPEQRFSGAILITGQIKHVKQMSSSSSCSSPPSCAKSFWGNSYNAGYWRIFPDSHQKFLGVELHSVFLQSQTNMKSQHLGIDAVHGLIIVPKQFVVVDYPATERIDTVLNLYEQSMECICAAY